jgi:methionyl-tRNA formyltransferase
MLGTFSYLPLIALLESGIEVCAVVIPANQSSEVNQPAIEKQGHRSLSRSNLPVLNSSIQSSILDLAHCQNIPAWKVRHLSNPNTIKVFEAYRPDILCVACFSMRIPRVILDLPRLGSLNVHPSLLPANRGPEPLFWTLREGGEKAGVTIHMMDEGLDSGAIVAQHTFAIPDGIDYFEFETLAADLGGKLLASSVWEMYNGVAVQVPQDETKSSYHAFPCDDDFVVSVAEWNAKHVYNFICGVQAWGTPMFLLIGDEPVLIEKAISYSLKTTEINHPSINKLPEKECWVRCKQGSVLVQKKQVLKTSHSD